MPLYKVVNNDVLIHYGIRGQKWGIRRFQDYDGSLTPEGRKRYGVGEGRRVVSGKELAKTVKENGWSAIDKYKNKELLNSSTEKILKEVNPNFNKFKDDVYMNNCVFCAVAFELRKRGYDFQAKGESSGTLNNYKPVINAMQKSTADGLELTLGYRNSRQIRQLDAKFKKIDLAYRNKDMDKYFRLLEEADRMLIGNQFKSKKDIYKKIAENFEEYGVGARGYIEGNWKNFDGGHAFSWEVRKDGAYFLDPQSGDVVGKVSDGHYIKDMYLCSIYDCRLDYLDTNELSPGLLNAVIYEEKENKK